MEVIKIASEAEREYIGLNNGILDQACIALGEKGKLLFLDTATEQYRLIEPGEDVSAASPNGTRLSISKLEKTPVLVT